MGFQALRVVFLSRLGAYEGPGPVRDTLPYFVDVAARAS